MPTPTKGPRLGGGPAHERLMLNNMARSLFINGRIVTTETKAKRLRPIAERLVNFAKRGDLAARRRVLQQITDKSVVHTLFTEIAPQVADREGGYTRITKLGFRKGDNAPMAVIELVLEAVNPKPKSNKIRLVNNIATATAGSAAVIADAGATDEVVEAAEVETTETVAAEAAAEAPAEAAPAEEAPVEEAPAAEAVAEETPAEETPAEEGKPASGTDA